MRVSPFQGSSPLARGLLDDRRVGDAVVGIIPARAGFTHRRGVRRNRRVDHPRSRGVYSLVVCESVQLGGSSPLARGLREQLDWLRAAMGIIPARAGFTKRWASPINLLPDHPRSRGVYSAGKKTPRKRAGSSPLARGLRLPPSGGRHSRWIIPARAGFTSRPGLRWPGQGDHPRSRGVYMSSRSCASSWAGSSPLARGLPRFCQPPFLRIRIIPARAGFTRARLVHRPRRQDHPRSRGVY